MKVVVLPQQNQVDVAGTKLEARQGLEIVLADDITKILDLVLLKS